MEFSAEIQTPLLPDDVVVGAVDYKSRPAQRSKSGGWKSAAFIIGEIRILPDLEILKQNLS